MFIKDAVLSSPDVVHGFFGRNSGKSEGLYKSLNCGLGTDDPAALDNRAIVAGQLGLEPENLLGLYQIHSAECVTVAQPWGERPQADAMATDKPGLGLGIVTADCAPVLFYGQKEGGAPVIGAAHAGWGGALKGVLEGTIEAMVTLGAAPDSLCAAVGPCIAPESYEVSEDFRVPFIAQDEGNEMFFEAAAREGHLMFDLPGYIARRLMLAGVAEISLSGVDTYFNEMDYFSYRRSVHKKEADYGRQISVIAICGQ